MSPVVGSLAVVELSMTSAVRSLATQMSPVVGSLAFVAVSMSSAVVVAVESSMSSTEGPSTVDPSNTESENLFSQLRQRQASLHSTLSR